MKTRILPSYSWKGTRRLDNGSNPKKNPWGVLRRTGKWFPLRGKARSENTTHFSRIVGQVNEDISTIGHLVKDHGKIFNTVRFQQNPFKSVLSEIGHDTILGIP